jgi:hypothetical protein
VVYATPAAIGGMSGGAWQHGGLACAVTTWTDGTHNMAQSAQALRATMRPEFFEAMEAIGDEEPDCHPVTADSDLGGFSPADFVLPSDAVPACETPQLCENGYFCEVSGLSAEEVVFGARDDAAEMLRELASGFDWVQLLEILLPILLEALRNRRR